MPAFEDISINLRPGVDTQKTLALNEAAISVSQLIRFKERLTQKVGGWAQFYPTPFSSPIRDIHAFQGLQNNQFLAVGLVGSSVQFPSLAVISCGVLTDITPQVTDTTPTPSFSITAGSNVVTVVDPGSSVGSFAAVRFDTPIALAGQVLSSAYKVLAAVDANTYTIAVDFISSATVSSGGTLPTFSASSGSAIVDVFFPSFQYQAIIGLFYPFRAATILSTGGANTTTVQGPYQVSSVIDSTHFQITLVNQSVVTVSSQTMNSSKAALHYYNTQGPPLTGGAYGGGAYGAGAYGLGTPAVSGTGTKITVTDWSLDNAGEFLIAIPKNQPVYYWAADTNLITAQVVATGPLFNIGGFVSQPQQIVMAFGSTQFTGQQDPLILRWSNSGDFTNWVVTPTTTAGSFRIPTGSTLIGAIQAPLFGVAWTDIDVWTATWAGQPLIWSFLRVGTGCGLIGQHAADVAQGLVYWCSFKNFFMLGPNGVQVLPCPVWDFIFQNIDTNNQSKVRAASNSQFNEISWFFPYLTSGPVASPGENTAYVKLHIGEGNEYEWDYGLLSRTAWVDTTVLGPPIGADRFGNLIQHEIGFDAVGTPINAYIETGYFSLGDGTELALVDWVIPDIRWQSGFGGAATIPGTMLFTFFTTDYPAVEVPGGSGARPGERVYGPFMVTQATQYINTRMRGRFWRCRIESNDQGTFWRIGKIKFRWGPSGRR